MLAVHENTVGIIQFRPSLSPAARNTILSHRPLSLLLDDEHWDITANRYRQLTADEVFKSIAALRAKTLKIRWNEAPRILYELKSIAFPELQELYLNGNNIDSVEMIFVVSLDNLRVLNLKENNISQLKALRKCKLPALEELTLYKNKVGDFKPLFEMHAPNLRTIWTTPQNDSFDSADNSWVFRMHSHHLKSLFVKHERSQPFDLQTWRQMAKRAFPKAKLVYRIKDDIALRQE